MHTLKHALTAPSYVTTVCVGDLYLSHQALCDIRTSAVMFVELETGRLQNLCDNRNSSKLFRLPFM